MEEIVKILMSGSLTFIGLIFTSLGIILTLKDNWKTKALRESKEFKDFLLKNVWCVISSVVIFVLSIIFLFVKELKQYPSSTLFTSGAILLCTIFICCNVICIVVSYKKLIELKSDDAKPNFSIEAHGEEED